jgi:hypothetical protein
MLKPAERDMIGHFLFMFGGAITIFDISEFAGITLSSSDEFLCLHSQILYLLFMIKEGNRRAGSRIKQKN